jgi:RNA polymerase sigma factor (TIGR02999 family)
LDAIEGGHEARGEITRLLLEAGEGDRQALDRVLPLVYEQLKTIARQRLRAEKADLTLDTTGLVHEAYLKLVAAMAMRRILVDRARRHLAEKRGAGAVRLPLESASLSLEDRAGAILEVEDALTRLAAVDERLARVVECRFFGGLTEEETAEAMGVTARTIRREWVKAKELLRQLLSGGRAGGEVERDAP